jgi:sugar (pentulose or hexulose) kinase
MLVIGIDVGTSSLKAELFAHDGPAVEVVASASRPYCADGRPLRDPEAWARLAREALAELAATGIAPAAIGFTGQMHSLIALDAAGEVLDPVMLWLDPDGAEDVAAFAAGHGIDMVRRTGKPPCPDFTLAKWLHARRTRAGFAARAAGLWCAKDFVRHRLDPDAAHVVDANEATGMQLYDPFARRWLAELVERAEVPWPALPHVRPATTRAGDAGAIDPVWAGVPLVLGVGDQAAAARAAGSFRPGVASLSLGTSGAISVPARMDRLPEGWTGGFHIFPSGFDDCVQIIGAIPATGGVFTWLAGLLDLPLEALDRLAASLPPGGAECHFFPFLAGAGAPHPDHRIRAELSGFGAGLGRAALARAVYDGLAMEFRAILDEVRAMGVTVEEVLISGGGARLPGLFATLAAFLSADWFTVDGHDASAIGAALIAADSVAPGNGAVLKRHPIRPAQACEPPPAWRARRDMLLGVG